MSAVDKRLSEVADEISFWKSEIVAEPHRADRLLDRLQLHLRERDHLLSLTDGERSRADELRSVIDEANEDDLGSDGTYGPEYVARLRWYGAVLGEYSAIMDGAAP